MASAAGRWLSSLRAIPSPLASAAPVAAAAGAADAGGGARKLRGRFQQRITCNFWERQRLSFCGSAPGVERGEAEAGLLGQYTNRKNQH